MGVIRRRAPVLPALLVFLAFVLLAYGTRYAVVEPEAMGALCAAAGAPVWCPLRTALIVVTEWNGLGLAAVAFALACLLVRAPARAAALGVVAMASAGAGLILYNATWASAATAIALVALARRGDDRDQPSDFEGRGAEPG